MGASWMLLSGAAFALMGVFVKMGAQWFSSHELVFYRSLVGLLLLQAMLMLRHGPGGGRLVYSAHIGLHLRRAVVGFLALSTFFHAVVHLPLSVAITLNYTSPLFLALFIPGQLGERLGRVQAATLGLGFIGVLLLLRPWESPPADLLAGLVGLLSGILAAYAYVQVRLLGRLGEPEWRTVYWFSLVCALAAGMLASQSGWHLPGTLQQGALLLGVGVFATLGQLAMTRAYRRGKTVVVAALAYGTVVFGSILDGLIFHVELPLTAWIGMSISVLAGVLAVQLNDGK